MALQSGGLGRRKTILVVDDEEEILALFGEVLGEDPRYEVLTAHDGNRGLILAQSQLPDLMILDVRMPGPSGYEICANLKRETRTSAIKVLICSGHCGPSDIELARELGADGFLEKPFTLGHLREAVAIVLEG